MAPEDRKRKYSSKVRTGCKTCRIRRVKCGEERPACQRCVSTGRHCDGYETFRVASASTKANGSLSLTWTNPSSQLSAISRQEQGAFHFFRTLVVRSLPGSFDDKLWSRYALPISMSEPVIHHAVVALGALGLRSQPGTGTQDDDRFALQHYSKAMKALHNRIAGQSQTPPDIVLLTCLMFVAFEWQQNGFDQAKSHLSGGLKIIREIDEDASVAAPASKPLMDELVLSFQRLDIQMSLTTSERVQLNRAVGLAQSTMLPTLTQLDSVKEASAALNVSLAAMRELVYMVESKKFAPGGICEEDFVQFEYEQMKQLISLTRWEEAVDALLPRLRIFKDQQATRQLQMSHICAKLMVSMSLSDGREVIWDGYTADFQRVVDLAQTANDEVVSPVVSPSDAVDAPPYNFSLEMGVIAPLYFIVLKCRHPIIRYKALDLLQACKHREGCWDGPTLAFTAESVVNLEERGLDVRKASDVPEASRLYQAFFDLRLGADVVHCKRRCFEGDGRWVDYQERVG